jgi:hypothetical protein
MSELPPGFTLDETSHGPELPPGFSLDRPPGMSIERDVAEQSAAGAASGIKNAWYLPNRIVNAASHALGGGDILGTPDFPTGGYHYMVGEPQTKAGRYARAIGENVGANVIPGVGLSGTMARAGIPLAEQLSGGLISSVGSGTGQEAAHAEGFGPIGQTVAGLAGGIAAPYASAMAMRSGNVGAEASRYVTAARADASGPQEAALQKVADKGVEAGIDWNAARAQVQPPLSPHLRSRGFTDDDVADIVSRGLRGEPAGDIARDYAHLTNAQGQSISPATVQAYVERYRERNPTPLNLMDIATDQLNAGGAQPLTRLGRAASGLSDNPEAPQRLVARQEEQPGRAQAIIQEATSEAELQRRLQYGTTPEQKKQITAQFESDRAQGRELETAQTEIGARVQAEAAANYARLHALPPVVTDENLGRILAQPLARSQWEKGRMLAEAEGQAIPSYQELTRTYGVAPKGSLGLNLEGTEGPGLTAEASYNLKQMRLEDQIAKARNSGKEDVAQELEKLKEGLSAQYTTKSTGQYPGEPPPVQPGTIIPVRAMDYFQRALRIDAERKGGTEGYAMNAIRQRVLDALDPANPTQGQPTLVPGFRQTMGAFKTGRADLEAMESGANTVAMTGARPREALREFEQMTPDQQHLFRLGFARRLMNSVGEKRPGANAVSQFLGENAQQMIRRVFDTPARSRTTGAMTTAGERMLEGLRAENITSGTKNEILAGSRTTPMRSDMDKLQAGAEVAANAATLRFGAIAANLANRMKYHIGEKQASGVLDALTQTDPADFLHTLNRLTQYARTSSQRQNYAASMKQMIKPSIPGTPAPGIIGATNMSQGQHALTQANQPYDNKPRSVKEWEAERQKRAQAAQQAAAYYGQSGQ